MLPALDALDAVRCWTGPLDAPHDFEISWIHVEAKARGSATPRVNHFVRTAARVGRCREAVSTRLGGDHRDGGERGCPDGDRYGEWQNPCHAGQTCDMAAVDVFEERLGAAGFDWADDYSDRSWLVREEALYEAAGRDFLE